MLAEAGFDAWLENCATLLRDQKGRRSIPPGVYFRMMLVGYFEGIDSQRGIAWRCSDAARWPSSWAPPGEETPDHSASCIRSRLRGSACGGLRAFWQLAAEKKLLKGKTVAVDSTTLEANAAMKSIVRRERVRTGKSTCAARQERGIENPSDEELRRFDKARKDKKVSNDEWVAQPIPTAASPA